MASSAGTFPSSSFTSGHRGVFASESGLCGGETTLVAEDEEPVLRLVRRVLEDGGFRTITSSGGAEALELMQHDMPDLVFLDLKMPDMDGPLILKKIRERAWGVPIVILTGYPDSELMSRALRYSPFTVLAKPSTREPILEAARHALVPHVPDYV